MCGRIRKCVCVFVCSLTITYPLEFVDRRRLVFALHRRNTYLYIYLYIYIYIRIILYRREVSLSRCARIRTGTVMGYRKIGNQYIILLSSSLILLLLLLLLKYHTNEAPANFKRFEGVKKNTIDTYV